MAESLIPLPPTTTIQTSKEPPRTLWMGDLDPSFDEATIQRIWLTLGHHVEVKLIRAKKNLLIPCSTSSTLSAMNVQDDRIQINGISFIDPNTTQLHHAGYCFVQFPSQREAQAGLQLNATPLPNVVSTITNNPTNPTGKRNFRLNWASGATLQSDIPTTPEYSLFVGDLAPTATEAHLLSLFQTKFKSVKTVRVMTDPITGASRCFGFVRFADENERRSALVEMNGMWCQGRQLRVAYATPRNNMLLQQQQNHSQRGQNHSPTEQLQPSGPSQLIPAHSAVAQLSQSQSSPPSQLLQTAITAGQEPSISMQQQPSGNVSNPNANCQNRFHVPSSNLAPQLQQQPQSLLMSTAETLVGSNTLAMVNHPISGYSEPSNTTVFIGGLSNQVTKSHLHSLFVPFGNIVSVKVPPGTGCGFVEFERRIDAEAAIQGMQGFIIGRNSIRLSWGQAHGHSNSTGSIIDRRKQQSQLTQDSSIPIESNHQQISMGLQPSLQQQQQQQQPLQQQQQPTWAPLQQYSTFSSSVSNDFGLGIPESFSMAATGCGNVGMTRVHKLIPTGCKLTIVSPDYSAELSQYIPESGIDDERDEWINHDWTPQVAQVYRMLKREFKDSDVQLHKFQFVLTCLPSEKVSAHVYGLCKKDGVGILCNVADVPDLCDFYFGSNCQLGTKGLQIMISSNGVSPRLTALLKADILQRYGSYDWDEMCQRLGQLRSRVRGMSERMSDLERDQIVKYRMNWITKVTDTFGLGKCADMDVDKLCGLFDEMALQGAEARTLEMPRNLEEDYIVSNAGKTEGDIIE